MQTHWHRRGASIDHRRCARVETAGSGGSARTGDAGWRQSSACKKARSGGASRSVGVGLLHRHTMKDLLIVKGFDLEPFFLAARPHLWRSFGGRPGHGLLQKSVEITDEG